MPRGKKEVVAVEKKEVTKVTKAPVVKKKTTKKEEINVIVEPKKVFESEMDQEANSESELESDSDLESDLDSKSDEIISKRGLKSNISISQAIKTPVFLSNINSNSNSNSNSKSDTDRVKLAQAINNFTIKSDELLQQMKNFEIFRESILSLDILIGTKKQEYAETILNLDSECKNKTKNMEVEYTERAKKLESDYSDRAKKLESDYLDKRKNLIVEYQDLQVEMRRKVTEDKTRYCTNYANEMKMRFIREDELNEIQSREQKSLKDYEDLKKTFEKQCDAIRSEEIKKYSTQLKTELNTMELTHRANNAQLQAQVEQQKREISMLAQTIESLKAEIREQRELTREVAQASSKAQITQTIGKN